MPDEMLPLHRLHRYHDEDRAWRCTANNTIHPCWHLQDSRASASRWPRGIYADPRRLQVPSMQSALTWPALTENT